MSMRLLNTLYVQTPGSLVRLQNDTLVVEVEGERRGRVPLHHIGAVVLFGRCSITSDAMQRCAEDGRLVTFLDHSGRFRCRVEGPESGNVLLRKAQFDVHEDAEKSCEIARRIVAAKIQGSRTVLLRSARDSPNGGTPESLRSTARRLESVLEGLQGAESLDHIRGAEGDAAHEYFGVFSEMIRVPPSEFAFKSRTRRPPRDRMNALLSFVYALLLTDCTSAARSVGLDAQVGFLHALRPGRASLALDLMEEFRAGLADRLVLTLVNRRQIRSEHFIDRNEAGGSVMLTSEGRRRVIVAYQERKVSKAAHQLLGKQLPLGLIPQIQARLLARHLRGDLPVYEPHVFR